MAWSRSWRWCCLLGALLLLRQPGSPASAQPQRLVLAAYAAAYDWSTWSQPLPDSPLEVYNSSSVVTIQRHVLQARSAGIDALVVAWYGPALIDNPTEPNLRILLDQAASNGLDVAVLLDMEAGFLQAAADVTQALAVLRDGHALHQAYLTASGRPVIFFYQQWRLSLPAWEAIRNQVDPQREMLWIAEGADTLWLSVFDGLYLYNIAGASDPVSLLVDVAARVRQWSASYGEERLWVATTMPGYDNSALPSAVTLVRDRDDGAYYGACWDGAVRTAADWVFISSFNQWLEGSQIEPSVTYGDKYLLLTAREAALYRNAVLSPTATPAGAAPTPTPGPESIVSPMPVTLSPTSAVPATPVTPTLSPEPSATLRPTATPLRLSTPTLGPPVTVTPLGTPPSGGQPSAPSAGTAALTPTHLPLLPVEGARPTRTCPIAPAALPLIVVAGVGWTRRPRRHT